MADHDIVPTERIVYSYDVYTYSCDMHLDTKRFSVSLATVEFKAAGAGTRLVFTRQAVFWDGYDDPAGREQGTRGLLEKLGVALERETGS